MNFHETALGRRFFEGQLPQLITSLKEISAALNAPKSVMQMNTEYREDYLVQLYYTNFDPENAPDRETHAFYDSAIAQMQGEIRDAVTGDLWQKIEHSYSTIATRTAAEREQAFAAGFRTAMTMMVCGLSAPKSNKDGGK